MSILVSCEAGGTHVPAWLLAEATGDFGDKRTGSVHPRSFKHPGAPSVSSPAGAPDASPEDFFELGLGSVRKLKKRSRSDSFQSPLPRRAADSGGEGQGEGAVFGQSLAPGTGLPGQIPGDTAAAYAARRLAGRLNAPLIENQYSPKVIDVTKSAHHRQLFPPAAKKWDDAVKKRLIEEIHAPYRARIRHHLGQRLLRGSTAIHLSVRTFASRGEGKTRRADVGLLYDPGRGEELELCLDWVDEMYDELAMLKVRRNYPRRGTSDSITKAMRAEWSGQRYVGIELQLNRAWASRPVAVRDEVLDGIAACFQEVTQISHSEAA